MRVEKKLNAAGLTRCAGRFIKIALLAVFAVFCGCREPVALESPDAKGNYATSFRLAEIFDRFWQAMNNNYVYWDLEPAGYWDHIYDKYMPMFESLGVLVAEESQTENVTGANALIAFKYFEEMLAPLHDGHLVVRFAPGWFYEGSPLSINPVFDNVKKRPTSPGSRIFFTSDWASDSSDSPNYNFWKNVIKEIYIDNDSGYDTYSLVPGYTIRAATGKISHEESGGYFLYLYFNTFSIYETLKKEAAYQEGNPKPLTVVMDCFKNALMDEGLRGVILDVRGNTGGMNIDISYLLGPMLSRDIVIAYTRTKRGPAPLDYLPWAPYVVPAAPANMRMPNITRPIVVLCNDYSISCAELLTLAVKSMPGGYAIGTKTWGALGPRYSDENPFYTNGGSFTGSPFWTQVVQAGFQTRGPDMKNYDGVGVLPNKTVEMSAHEIPAGKDFQLAAAIQYLKERTPVPPADPDTVSAFAVKQP
ncbi:MAG: hypothetical protein LBC77_01290 [Spirochaetaceae bacterium]|jgi:hypothetical protein|nr:hypothetical protein [Spirochaetaceae bacterium]